MVAVNGLRNPKEQTAAAPRSSDNGEQQLMRAHHIAAMVLSIVCTALLRAQAPAAGDWPQWLGPNRTGLSSEVGLLKQWPAQGPAVVWSASGIGAGYGSIAVKGDRIFVQGSNGK